MNDLAWQTNERGTEVETSAVRHSHADWPNSDIDRFVLAKLEEQGLQPVRIQSTQEEA